MRQNTLAGPAGGPCRCPLRSLPKVALVACVATGPEEMLASGPAFQVFQALLAALISVSREKPERESLTMHQRLGHIVQLL